MDDEVVVSPVTEAAPDEAVTGSAPVEKPEVVESVEAEPQSNSDWARIRVENKELKERLAALESEPRPSPFDQVKPQETYQDPGLNWNQFGYVDPNKVREETSQVVTDKLDEYKARQEVPQMSDPDFEELVAAKWFLNRTQGKPTSIYTEAKKLADKWSQQTKKEQQAAVKEAIEQVSAKEAASLADIGQNSSSAQRATAQSDLESLRQASRGSGPKAEAAIAERLKDIPLG